MNADVAIQNALSCASLHEYVGATAWAAIAQAMLSRPEVAVAPVISWANYDGLSEMAAERDEAYRDRAMLVAALARVYGGSLEQTDPSPGFKYVCYIPLPTGQVSYHIADDDLDLFAGVQTDMGVTWDGTGDDVKAQRLRDLRG